jgi:hypothetical protein
MSKKHGINPSMTQCFYCGEAKDIILVGSATKKLKEAGVDVSDDGKMPMLAGVFDIIPCDDCKEYMEQGIILISVRDGAKGISPYRTGGWVVIKEDAFQRAFNPEAISDQSIVESICKSRWAFLEDTVWDAVGLPRGEINNDKN